MCGHYHLNADEDDVETQRVLRALSSRLDLPPNGEVTPALAPPVYTQDGPLSARWGLPLRERRALLIHLRAETALEKPAFRRALLGRGRCLLPATAYDEWQALESGRRRWRFRALSDGCFFMAAVLLPAAPGELPAAVMLTTAANESVRFCHRRMPLILPKERCREFLFDPARTRELLRLTPPPLQPVLL